MSAYPTFEDGAPETLEILAIAPAVRGEEDRFNGTVTLNGPMEESQALTDAIGGRHFTMSCEFIV